MKPLAIDLFCGLGGWAEGFLAEGFDVIGFDVERHDYGTGGYPGQLVIQDVLTLHGSQFRDAAVIVASPPCQEFSYMAMPWKRAKQIARALRGDDEFPAPYTGSRTIVELTALFEACFRIQREANEATGYICLSCGAPEEPRTVMVRPAGYGHTDDLPEHEWCPECFHKSRRHIPLIVENVRGAIPWVGHSAWNFGSYHLWGDLPALMPIPAYAQKFNPDGTGHPPGSWFKIADSKNRGQKVGVYSDPRRNGGRGVHLTSQHENLDGLKFGVGWWRDLTNNLIRKASSKSPARKAASAQIAKIPFPLAQHIARCYLPEQAQCKLA